MRRTNKQTSNCNGCGELLPPWASLELCPDCDAESGTGSSYPRVAADYSTQYEDSAFDSAVVNEVVR